MGGLTMKEPPKPITEQFCANCLWFGYFKLEPIKTCLNDNQSHNYVKETDYCFRHELDENKKKQLKGKI